MKVAIQGEKASFHDVAATQFFGKDIELICCETFHETFAALADGRADHAVCAIENSLYGSIIETYDLLIKNDFVIIGEVYLRIEQCLIGMPGADVASIQEVYSHPVALAQCEEYLDTTLPKAERFEYHDTAASVAKVRDLGDPTIAGIASSAAAKLYDMEVLAHSIETDKQNYTRFIVIDKEHAAPERASKTSLMLVTTHNPGGLYRALGTFAHEMINLSKLESRPIIGNAWEYMFLVDIDAGMQDERTKRALEHLQFQNCKYTILGSYEAAPKKPIAT